jgi:tetratricopeptide (TPR) repeat protein
MENWKMNSSERILDSRSLRHVFRLTVLTQAFLVCFGMLSVLTSLIGQRTKETTSEKYSQEGQQALAEGRYADAKKSYEKLRDLQPQVAEVHANLGLIYFQERRFGPAASELRLALRLKPSLAKIESLLAMSMAELGQYREALAGLEKGFRSTDPEIKRMSGLQLERAYTGLRRNSKAVEVALELDRLYPDDPEVLYHDGRIFGNFAFLIMERLARAAPDSIWRHQAVAEAAESQESFDIAISEYRRVLVLNPDQPGVHYRLGRSLLRRARKTSSSDDLPIATKEFEEELARDPRNGNALYELAELRRDAGQFAEAQELFEKALSFHPDFEEAHVGLAYVFRFQNRLSAALTHLQNAIALNPEDEVAWYRLSLLQRSLGNVADAEQARARFQQLRLQKSKQEQPDFQRLSSGEVTPQTVDPSEAK